MHLAEQIVNFSSVKAGRVHVIAAELQIIEQIRQGDRLPFADRYEAVFHALCECAGIPQEVLIQAARIEDRYYERGGTRCLDLERLIRSLL